MEITQSPISREWYASRADINRVVFDIAEDVPCLACTDMESDLTSPACAHPDFFGQDEAGRSCGGHCPLAEPLRATARPPQPHADRKSPRLNSSHSCATRMPSP